MTPSSSSFMNLPYLWRHTISDTDSVMTYRENATRSRHDPRHQKLQTKNILRSKTYLCLHVYLAFILLVHDLSMILTFRNLASYIWDGRKITLQTPHFIFIQQISVLNILSTLYNLHFFSSKCHLFHNATLFGFCITHILNTECAKIKKKNPSPKG